MIFYFRSDIIKGKIRASFCAESTPKEVLGLNDFENKDKLEETPTAETPEEVTTETEEAAENVTAESELKQSELEEELENIKDMFQKELDDAQTLLAGGDLQDCADEGEEETEENEDEEIPAEELCECCGERRRDTSVSDDYPYCAECRELMKVYPFSAKGILTLIVTLILSAVSVFYIFNQNSAVIDAALTADQAYAEGKLYSAFNGYYQAVSSAKPKAVPVKVAAKCAKALAELNDFADAASIADQYIPDWQMKLPNYSFIKAYAKKNDTLTAIQNIVYETLSSGEATAEDAEELKTQLEALKSSEEADYDAYYIDYYKYVVDLNINNDKKAAYEYLKKLDETYGKDEWIHCYDLCNLAANLGLVDEAEKYFNILTRKNTEDASAYSYLATAYRFTEKPDADKMLELIEKGIEAQGSYTYSNCDLYRAQAVAYLLKGDKEAAYNAAYNMYYYVYASNYQVNNLYSCLYTYALCCKLQGEDEAYGQIEDLFKQNGMKMSQDVIDAAKGDKTIEEVLTDSEGDLA